MSVSEDWVARVRLRGAKVRGHVAAGSRIVMLAPATGFGEDR